MVIHFKYSNVYISIPNSLTIPSHILLPATITSFSEVCESLSVLKVHLYYFFLDSFYIVTYITTFLLLCLIYFTQYGDL